MGKSGRELTAGGWFGRGAAGSSIHLSAHGYTLSRGTSAATSAWPAGGPGAGNIKSVTDNFKA